MSKLNLVFALSLGGTSLIVPSLAEAHFMLVAPTSWWTQLSDGTPQKLAPCGDEATAGTAASGTVNVYQPGQPITVTVSATVAHPGWWRISLREGKSSTQVTSTFPDPTPLGASGSAQQCTPAFINNPVWSPTQPVLLDKLGLPAGSTSTTTVQSGTQSFQVTIPATAQCTSASPCTLQVLMLMTDHPAGSCNYHHCVDLAAAAGASDGGVTGTGGASGTGGRAGTGTGGATGTGGRIGTGIGGTSGIGGGIGTIGTGGSSGGGIGGANGAASGGAIGSTGTGGSPGAGEGSGGATATGPDASDAARAVTDPSTGCSCAVGSAAGPSALGSVLVLAALLARRRRRRPGR